MKKEFEAYYSQEWNGIFIFLIALLCLFLVFTAVIGVVFASPGIWAVVLIVIAALCAGVVFAVKQYRYHSRCHGIAVEVVDDVLILHKPTVVRVPLSEVRRINIHDEAGSFDLIIYTKTGKASMHCFVVDQAGKRREFIELMKSKDIRIATFTLAGN